MHSRSFVRALHSTIRASLVALSTISVASAGTFGSAFSYPTSCLAHDLGLEHLPQSYFKSVEIMGPMPSDTNDAEESEQALRVQENEVCIRSANQFEMQGRIDAAISLLSSQIEGCAVLGKEIATQFTRSHQVWRLSTESYGTTFAKMVEPSSNPQPQPFHGCQWDCEQSIRESSPSIASTNGSSRAFGELGNGNHANIFVFTFPAVSDSSTPSICLSEAGYMQRGMDPVCNEVQSESATRDWRGLFGPDVCILAPDLLDSNSNSFSTAIASPSDRNALLIATNDSAMPEEKNITPPTLEQPIESIMIAPEDARPNGMVNVIASQIAASISPSNWHELNVAAWTQQMQFSRRYGQWIDRVADRTIQVVELKSENDAWSDVQSWIGSPDRYLANLYDVQGRIVPFPMAFDHSISESTPPLAIESSVETIRLESSKQIARGLRIMGSTLLQWSQAIESNVRMAERSSLESSVQ